MNKKNLKVYLGMLIAMIIMSLTFIWFKLANRILHPFSIVFFRLVIASVFLTGLSVFTKNLQTIAWKDLKFFLLLTFFTPFGYFLFEGLGLSLVPASLGAVIVSTIPLFIPVGAHLWLGERLTAFNIFGIILSFTGVLLIIMGKGFHVSANPLGILLMILAVFMAVSYTLLLKKLSSRYNAFTLTAWQNILGIIFFLPLFLVYSPQDLGALSSNIRVIMPLLYLGILGSAIAFIFFNDGIKHLGATRAESFTYLIPVLTAMFACFILSEPLTLRKATGIFIVLAGVLLTQIKSINVSFRHRTVN